MNKEKGAWCAEKRSIERDFYFLIRRDTFFADRRYGGGIHCPCISST